MQRRFLEDPLSVDGQWRAFFSGLAEDRDQAQKSLRGASWRTGDRPARGNGDLLAAMDGLWPAAERIPASAPQRTAGQEAKAPAGDDVRRATMDSVRTLMMIRAYRMRGHLAADLDPLKLRTPEAQPELDPASYGFGPGDLDRPIFIDNVLGLERATIRQITDLLQRTYCGSLGVEFMHISDPVQKAWIQERIEGPDKVIEFTAIGKKSDPQQAHRGGRLRAVPQHQIHGNQTLRSRRRGSRPFRRSSRSSSAAARSGSRRSCSAWRIAAA